MVVFFMSPLKYSPSWQVYEKDLHSEDAEVARKAAEAFDIDRQKEMANSPQARKYEESRKAAWAKDKPQWVKERIKAEQAQEQKIINDLREGGYLMGGLKPSPGLVLVKKTKQEGLKEGEIFIPDNVEYESNLALVIRVGNEMQVINGKIEAPCKEGDTVLFRKGAGLNVKLNGEPHLIIRFDEIFGVVEE
jgi:chaperonin GroES